MSEPYSEKVLDHFRNPRNVGEMENPDGIGHVGNIVCGDIMELYIKVKDGIITDAKFKTFGCLTPEEEIVSANGGWERIQSITKGAGVLNSEGEKTEVVETYVRDYRGQMLKIYPFVSPFNSFNVTPEHPIYCIKREWVKGARRSSSNCDWLRVEEGNLLSTNPDFIKAKELSEGDYLIFNVSQEIKDNNLLTKEIMRLIGYYLSEGYISALGSVVAFAFNKKEKSLIKEVKALLQKVIGKKPKCRIRGNVIEIYVCSRKLVRFLTLHCKKIARNKALSEDLLLLPFLKQWEMIKTYLCGDGDIYRRRPRNTQTYRVTTTSRILAIQIQEILARGEIFTSIRQIYKSNCYIDGRRLKDSIQYVITFKLERENKFVHSNGKYFLVPIRKIEKSNYQGKVYNFQVLGEPNAYLVKGFAVHNCGAAVATSSMVTEMVKGKTVEEALRVSNKAVAEALDGLPPHKLHCSVLAEEALKSAIEDYLKKSKGDKNLK